MWRLVVGVLALLVLATTPLWVTSAEMSVIETYSYQNISTADNTIVRATPGILAGVIVNGGTIGAITIYDNTTCTGTGIIATIAAPYAGQVIPLGVKTARGICINTAAATNITVIYR